MPCLKDVALEDWNPKSNVLCFSPRQGVTILPSSVRNRLACAVARVHRGDPGDLPPVHRSAPATDLFRNAVVAIDSSKFKAVNARDKNFTRGKLKRRMDQVEAIIEHYMAALETADRQKGELVQAGSIRLNVATRGEHITVFA